LGIYDSDKSSDLLFPEAASIGNTEENDPPIMYPTDKEEVYRVVNSVESKNNESASKLTNSLLKFCREELVKPITHIINLSFKTGTVPDVEKIARIVPIYKEIKSDSALMNNYRPIAILPVLLQVLEKVVKPRLLKHLESTNFFFKNQFGYRTNKNMSVLPFKLLAIFKVH